MTSEYATQKWAQKKTPGMLLGRYCQALIAGKGYLSNTKEFARAHFSDTPQVLQTIEMLEKAAVAPATGSDPSWAAPLVLPVPLAAEFTALVTPQTIFDRIPWSRAPFNCSFGRVTSPSGVGWIGENTPLAVSRMSLATVKLGYQKLGSITVITNELANFSSPQAATIIAKDVTNSAAKFTDQQMLSPGVSAIPGVRPASITNGAHVLTSSGNALSNVILDLKALFKVFTDAEIPLSQSVLIMSERVATAWATLAGTGGEFAFENLGVAGGDIFGVEVVTSAYPIEGGGSPTEETVILVHPDSVAVADAGVAIDIARQGSLVLDSAPNSPAQLYSLFQNSATALRVIRYLDYVRRREDGVACIGGINL